MQKRKYVDLSFKIIDEVKKIWASSNWQFENKKQSDKAFDDFCLMLQLTPTREDQEFILNLTTSFKKYSFSNYMAVLSIALLKVDEKYLNDITHIVFAPLINPDDSEKAKAKSCHGLVYPVLHFACKENEEINKLNLSSMISPIALNPKLNKSSTLIIFLDDFIGSGETAKKAMKSVQENKNTNKSKFLIITIAAMQHAVKSLEEVGIHVICADTLTRGIADNDIFPNKANAYEIANRIWEKLKINDDYRYGYKSTEALVSMLRTPNNTFPMYWCKNGRNKRSWPAPFPR